MNSFEFKFFELASCMRVTGDSGITLPPDVASMQKLFFITIPSWSGDVKRKKNRTIVLHLIF